MVNAASLSPITALDTISQQVWTVQQNPATDSAEVVLNTLRESDIHFRRQDPPDHHDTSVFLQSVAHIIFRFHDYPEIISTCVRTCGVLLIKDPTYETRKKRIIIHQFANPIDLVHLARLTFNAAVETDTPRRYVKAMSTFSYLMQEQLDNYDMPSVIEDSYDYIAGTLEYFAFLPDEIAVSGRDFLPEYFMQELENRMAFYGHLSRYRIDMP